MHLSSILVLSRALLLSLFVCHESYSLTMGDTNIGGVTSKMKKLLVLGGKYTIDITRRM